MKLLHEKFSILTIHKSRILENNEWIMEYTDLKMTEEPIRMTYIKDDTFLSFKKNAF